jgi:hypothetical protein
VFASNSSSGPAAQADTGGGAAPSLTNGVGDEVDTELGLREPGIEPRASQSKVVMSKHDIRMLFRPPLSPDHRGFRIVATRVAGRRDHRSACEQLNDGVFDPWLRRVWQDVIDVRGRAAADT